MTFGHQSRHGTFGVTEITEMPRPGGTGPDTGRRAILFLEILIVDAIDAEGALLHHPLAIIIFARAIRTGPGAELAADACIGID